MRAVPSALLAVAAVGLAGCGSSSSGRSLAGAGSATPVAGETAPSTATSNADDGGYGGAAGAPAAAAGALKIAGYKYDPTPLTVKTGQVVSVANTDSAEHTATSDIAGLFVADDIKAGTTVTFKAPAKPGRYTFHCEYHASMHGTLIVN